MQYKYVVPSLALSIGSSAERNVNRTIPQMTQETKPSGSVGRNEPKKKNDQPVPRNSSNMEMKVGKTLKKTTKPAAVRKMMSEKE